MNFTYIFGILIVPSVIVDIFNTTLNSTLHYIMENEIVYSNKYDEFYGPVGEYYEEEYVDDYVELI